MYRKFCKRSFAVIAIAAGLAACADSGSASLTLTPRANRHCETVARQRAVDAALFGASADDQKRILDGNYADCDAWDRAHGGDNS